MRLTLKCMLATVLVLILLMSMVGAALANEAYSKPVDLRGRMVKPDDNKSVEQRGPAGDPVDNLVGDPEPELESGIESEPAGDPEGNPEGDPASEPAGTPDGDPESEPVGDPEGNPDGEPASNPEGEPEADPQAEPGNEPVGEPEAAPASDPEDSTEPGNSEDVNQTDLEPVPVRIVTEDMTGLVNVSDVAGNDGTVIGQFPSGALVTLLRYEGNWAFIVGNGVMGYVHERFIDTGFAAGPTGLADEPDEGEGDEEGKDLEEEILDPDVPMFAGLNVMLRADKPPETVNVGDQLTLWVEVEGANGAKLSYQWQKRAGGEWMDIPGESAAQYSFIVTPDDLNCSWRASVSAEA